MKRDANDGIPVPIRQGLVNLYKLDKSYCAKYNAAEKGCSISYRSRSSHSRVEAAEVIHKQRLCRVKEIKMLFKDLQTNPAAPKAHQKGITCIKSPYSISHRKYLLHKMCLRKGLRWLMLREP